MPAQRSETPVSSTKLRTTSFPGRTKTTVAIDPGDVASVHQELYVDDGGRHQCCISLQDGSQVYVQGEHRYVAGVPRAAAAIDPAMLIRAAEERGAVAVPAHPGRFGIGLYDFIENGADFSALRLIERLNGSDRSGEQERTEQLIARYGYAGTGGSDAHLASARGACMTRFDGSIEGDQDLVRELRAGNVQAVHLQDTKRSPSARTGKALSNLL